MYLLGVVIEACKGSIVINKDDWAGCGFLMLENVWYDTSFISIGAVPSSRDVIQNIFYFQSSLIMLCCSLLRSFAAFPVVEHWSTRK